LRRLLGDSFISIDSAQNLIVMHVLPGNANAVAVLLDHLSWSELLGTVCGDDTILLIARSEEQAKEVTERILEML